MDCLLLLKECEKEVEKEQVAKLFHNLSQEVQKSEDSLSVTI